MRSAARGHREGGRRADGGTLVRWLREDGRSTIVRRCGLSIYLELPQRVTVIQPAASWQRYRAADTTLEQLRHGFFVLIGGFNNLWTERLSQELRFWLVTLNDHENVIQDSQHPSTVWTLNVTRSALANSRDYGLVSCFSILRPNST
jgi:hypothetical protein